MMPPALKPLPMLPKADAPMNLPSIGTSSKTPDSLPKLTVPTLNK